jgi:hypothetical protein
LGEHTGFFNFHVARMSADDRKETNPLYAAAAIRFDVWVVMGSHKTVVFRPYPPWVVGAGSGRVPGPKFAAGTAAGVLPADFWATRRARNPLDFVRWVVPIKARGRYTLCSAIHRAEGVRRVRNGDFWKCV